MASDSSTTTYKAPPGVVGATIGGVEHAVEDGLLVLENLPTHLHDMLVKSMGFAVATEADIEGIFDSKSAKGEKAKLVAAIKGAGLNVDGRASLSYVRKQYDAYVAAGKIDAAALADDSVAGATDDAQSAETTPAPGDAANAAATPEA